MDMCCVIGIKTIRKYSLYKILLVLEADFSGTLQILIRAPNSTEYSFEHSSQEIIATAISLKEKYNNAKNSTLEPVKNVAPKIKKINPWDLKVSKEIVVEEKPETRLAKIKEDDLYIIQQLLVLAAAINNSEKSTSMETLEEISSILKTRWNINQSEYSMRSSMEIAPKPTLIDQTQEFFSRIGLTSIKPNKDINL